MSEGIRATVEFPARAPCPIAGVSAETESVVDGVWTSVSATGSSPTVSEFIVESPEPPERPDLRHVLSLGGRHLLRLDHGGEETCPCECLGEFGCAVQRYVARTGTLRLVFNTADYEELQGAVGALRDRFPAVDVRRLVRSPDVEGAPDVAFVDRGRLTERQLEVLQTAHSMGYFDRPRGSNAEAVSAELDIDPSTFAEHLAAAQSKLLEDILEDSS